jgi:DNA mismatch endonuclease (patch repair protein)
MLANTPTTNVEFWERKFQANTERDKRNIRELESLGWKVIIIWECETKDPDTLAMKLQRLLSSSSTHKTQPHRPSPNTAE